MVRRVALVLLVVLTAALPLHAQKKGKKAEATAKLMEASASGDADEILAALKAGGDPAHRDDDRNTPLIMASMSNYFGREEEVVKAFVKAKASLEASNKDGLTPLMVTAFSDRPQMTKALLAAGAKVNAKDSDGWTALSYAAHNGKSFVVDVLLEAKATVDVVDKYGNTPIVTSIGGGHSAVTERLLAAGAKIPEKTAAGLTPLLLAAFSRNLATVRQMLELDPDLNARDKEGWTALEIAASWGDEQIVMELLRAGADLSLVDQEGKSALDRAIEFQRPETIALLGGKWERRVPSGGSKIAVKCPVLGGVVDAHVGVVGDSMVLTTSYPKPLSWYLGGGQTNRAKSAKQFTYDGSVAPTYYLDTDSNAKTGRGKEMFEPEAAGAEYVVGYSEYGTGVTLQETDAEGNPKYRNVYANVLGLNIEAGDGNLVDTSGIDPEPDAINENGILTTTIPLSLLELKPGKTIKVTTKIGNCPATTAKVKLK
jgi:ankyrin repeat protein